MRRRSSAGSGAMLYSLSEFAYILLFLSLGAAVLLYGRSLQAEREAAELTERVGELSREVDFLNELLAEKEHGVVPCWRRPEAVIPAVAGVVTIRRTAEYTLERTASEERLFLSFDFSSRETDLEQAVRRMFRDDLIYAREKNCYIRMAVVNETNSFTLFREVSGVLGRLGIVVVNQ